MYSDKLTNKFGKKKLSYQFFFVENFFQKFVDNFLEL